MDPKQRMEAVRVQDHLVRTVTPGVISLIIDDTGSLIRPDGVVIGEFIKGGLGMLWEDGA